jgi:opacity protein-like surface antigen
MKKVALLLSLSIAAILASDAPARAEGITRRELLGVRIGGVIGSPSLRDAFGAGSELELYFIEGLGPSWGVTIALSSHNFGASKDTLANIEYTGLNREVKLSIFSMTAAFYALRPLGGRFTATGEGGFGLYAVTASIPSGFYEGTRTENRFGLYSGLGALWRISRGISLNLNVKYHYIFIGSDEFEAIHFYTGDTSAHFFQIAIGVLLFSK